MLFLYILIALFVAWIWVDYFRLIDIFDRNNLLYVLLIFLLGACSVGIVLLVQRYILFPSSWQLNGKFWNDLLYSIFGIGLVEEIAKISPFLLLHRVFRKSLREPIDYLAFVCISALGFSAAENVMYFELYGAQIIVNRSILCSITHMFDTAILGYGFILLRFHPDFRNPLIIFLFLFLAALSHGIYDFLLLYDGIIFSSFIHLLFFFVTISVFSTIINNTLNNSAHFTYKKAINTDQLVKRMFLYYGAVFGIQFLLFSFEKGINVSLFNLLFAFFFSGIIVSVAVLRLSRFTLIEGRWNKIKLELPFYVRGGNKKAYTGIRPFGLRIKGSTYNEAYLAQLFHEYVFLVPVKSSDRSPLAKLGYIAEKIFVKDDEVHYLVRVFQSDKNSDFETILIRPKPGALSHTKNNFPIVARMNLVEIPHPSQPNARQKKYRFAEWVYLKKASAEFV